MIKKAVIIITIIILFSLGLVLFNYYKTGYHTYGNLKLKVYPPNSLVKINDKIYNLINGNLNIKLKAGDYLLNCFLNGYLSQERKIKIEPEKNVILEDIYLLPLNWKKIVLVEKANIKNITLSENNNRIFYITQDKDKNSKISYQWFIFDRETKTTEEFFNSSVLPLKLHFLSRKVLAELKPNNWQIILPAKSLLRDLNILTQSLNNLFEKQLSNLDIKLSKNIKEAMFLGKEENEIVIKTEDAIFFLNLLDEKLELIYEGVSSPFIFSNKNLYFIDKSGLLSQATLSPSIPVQQLSLFSFGEKDLDKIKIIKYPQKEKFLIIDNNNKLYYFDKETTGLPVVILEDIENADFSLFEEIVILKQKNKANWLIYNLNNQKTLEIESQIKPINFLTENYWLIIKDNKLGIYDLIKNNFSLIDEGIINDSLYFDFILKKIFYAKDDKIIEISY